MNTFNMKFSLFSSLQCLLAPFLQPTPCHFPKEGGEVIVSEQPQSSSGRAGQPRQLRLRRRAAPSTQGLLLFAWGAGILSHLMLQWKISVSCGFRLMLLHKILDLPFHSSFVLLRSAAVHLPGTGFQFGKTPRRRTIGEEVSAGMQPALEPQPSPSQGLETGPCSLCIAPVVLQQHLQPTPQAACAPSA